MPSIKQTIDALPSWLYNVTFNYATLDTDDISLVDAQGAMISTYKMFNYTLYNKRRKPTAFLTIKNVGGSITEATLVLTPWSWDSDPNVQENRLGLARPAAFAFNDQAMGSITFRMLSAPVIDYSRGWARLTGEEALSVYAIEEEHMYYGATGRLSRKYSFTRAAPDLADVTDLSGKKVVVPNYKSGGAFVARLMLDLAARVVLPTTLLYPSGTITYNLKDLTYPAYSMFITDYQELSAEMYQSRMEQHTATPIAGEEPWKAVVDTILATIPKISRVSSLDSGKWLPVDLSDSPTAAAARYNGYVFNNAYYNLNNVADVGLQQIIGAADADFIYEWERTHAGNFNDIRALKSALFSYAQLLAAVVCRTLRIRLTYLNYVAAVIIMIETQRGSSINAVYDAGTLGVHKVYPFINNIAASYEAALPKVFALLRVDLGANDTTESLISSYKTHIVGYNTCMAGQTPVRGGEVSQLGTLIKANVHNYLRVNHDFIKMTLWADIDQALSAAFMSDVSLSGNVEINDPAIAINPGDTINLNFLDETNIAMKAVGFSLSMSPGSFHYSVAVKRLL